VDTAAMATDHREEDGEQLAKAMREAERRLWVSAKKRRMR
jgi:hypothetical protein